VHLLPTRAVILFIMKQQWIGVLDCNNFFVSCERLFRPDLMKKPVVVLSSNDGCIVARSQEVKDISVPMGVPYFQVKDSLKDIGTVSFSSNFTLYRDISRRVFSVMRETLTTVEQYSIDEAFFSVYDEPQQVSELLKKKVEQKVGIPVSVGVGSTKTQAKCAVSIAKRGSGVCVLDKVKWNNLTKYTRLAQVWGVGGKLEMKYKKHGIVTVHDLLVTDVSRIAKLFGVGGIRLQNELSGMPVFSVSKKLEKQKSLVSSRSFHSTTTEFKVLSDALAYHVRHAAADLRAMNLKTKNVHIAIRPSRNSDFFLRGGSKEAVLPTATNDTLELLRTANELLRQIYEPTVPYKKAGVTFGQLISTEIEQKTLFYNAKNDHSELMDAVDSVNERFGKEAVIFGGRLSEQKWQARKDLSSPAYTTRWRQIATASA